MRTLLQAISCIFCLFIVSILVRSPHIDRPLSTNYEWVTAHTLVTLQIWEDEGIITHGFRPIYTFSNPNDHYIKCPISGISDNSGNYYYVSYPPFAFIFPYLVFKTLGISANVLALESLNLVLHFLCAILVYLILSAINKTNTRISTAGLIGASIYIFSPLSLWHHSNVFFADILVQVIFLLAIYLSYLFLYRNDGPGKALSTGLFVTLFLMAYTEWVGFLFAGCLALVGILFRKHSLFYKRLIFISITSASLAGLTILFQYGSINGLEDFFNMLLNRYSERSGHIGRSQFYDLDAHLFLLNLYLRNYFPQFVILAVLGALLLILKTKPRGFFSVEEKTILLLSLLPAILHHVVLFEFTLVHDMALVKTCIFISLLSGLFFHRIQQQSLREALPAFKFVAYLVVVAMLSLSVFFYHSHVIEPNGFSLEALGKEIKESSKPEDTVFFKTTQTLGDFIIEAPLNFVIAPQIQYYSGRCIQVIPTLEAAREHLKTYNKPNGIIFTIENSRYQIEKTERISLSDTTNQVK